MTMGRKIPVTIGDDNYESLSEVARACNTSLSLVRKYYSLGRLHELYYGINERHLSACRGIPVQIGDDTYESLKEAAQAYSVSARTIAHYHRKGDMDLFVKDFENGTLPQAPKGLPVTIGNRTWPSLRSCAIELGVGRP